MSSFFLWTIAFCCSALPAFGWVLLWRRKDKAEPEPKRMILLAFLFGNISILPFFFIRHFWGDALSGFEGMGAVLVFAFAEEVAKAFALVRLGKYLKIYFTQLVDGIVYATALGLGFAFAENILYFFFSLSSFGVTEPFWEVVAFRSIGTMLAHSIFSGIFGFFWGYAFFSKKIAPYHRHSVSEFFRSFFETLRFHIIFSHVLFARESSRGHEKGDLVREAFLLAVILHILFNSALEFSLFGRSLTVLLVPLLMGGFLFLSHQFLQKRNIDIFTPV